MEISTMNASGILCPKAYYLQADSVYNLCLIEFRDLIMRTLLCRSLIGFFLLLSLTAYASPLKILATIPPLAFIAHDIAGDAAHVEILLPPGSSPHHYQLKPSDRIKLAQADLVLWLGGNAENYLVSVLSGSAAQKKSLAVLDLSKMKSLLHYDSELDIHFWLNPKIMNLFAQQLAENLAQRNPAQAKIFRQRAFQFSQQISLMPKQHSALAMIEVADAFGYLHRALGVTPLLIINNHEDRPPSPKQRLQLQTLIHKNAKACIIITPEITEVDTRRMLNNTSPIILSLDPLGYDYRIKPNTFQYVNFFQQLTQNYLRCAH